MRMSFLPATPIDEERPPSPARRVLVRFAIAGVLILLLSGAATATIALTKLNHIAGEVFPKANQLHIANGVVETAYSGEPQTFMILGSDRRAGSKDAYDRNDPPHSDTLLLVHLDPNYGQISVLSVPRDLLVSITTRSGQIYYPSKINAAYTIGSAEGGANRGVELTAKTIERLLHIKLNGVIDVSFKGFRDVVDTLGCVYVNVDHRYLHQSEATEAGNYSSINLQPGYQKLCYENALSYVRYRHGDSDFVRVARQQDFLRNLREQVPVGNLVGEIDKVSKAVGRAVTTTFHSSAGQLIELAKLAAFSQQKPLRQVKFQVDNANAMISGNSYVTASPALIKATVERIPARPRTVAPAELDERLLPPPPPHGARVQRLAGPLSGRELGERDGCHGGAERTVPAGVPLGAERPGGATGSARVHAARRAQAHPPRLRRRLAAGRARRLLRRGGHGLGQHSPVRPRHAAEDRRAQLPDRGRRLAHPRHRLAYRESHLFRDQHAARGPLQRADDRDRTRHPPAAIADRDLPG